MILYIMRHAEAVAGSDSLQENWRYLTEKGRSTAEKVATQIAKTGPKPRLTITSPLTRAVQTAEIVAQKACRKNIVVVSELLLPGNDTSDIVTHLDSCHDAKRVMLVGHEPQLGQLVAQLLGHSHDEISMKPGSCVALELDRNSSKKPATFLWYLVPGKKRITSFKKAFPKLKP